MSDTEEKKVDSIVGETKETASGEKRDFETTESNNKDDKPAKSDTAIEGEPKKKKKKKSRHSRYADLEEPKTDSDDSDDDKDVDDEKLIVEDGEEVEDDLAEIDVGNIITQGRRTRGKVIDYSKVEEELKKEGGEEDEDEDDDFKEKEEKK